VLGMKSGMDMEMLLTVLKDSFAYSKAMDNRGERMIKANYDDPMSRLRQHHKDVGLMLEQGQKQGSPMLLTSVLKQVLVLAEENGQGDWDTASSVEVLRRMAGIPSR
jgi:3-hydroxyisobutyrate dehydrogenase-like beta-hydroxyacid dehydrogenase